MGESAMLRVSEGCTHNKYFPGQDLRDCFNTPSKAKDVESYIPYSYHSALQSNDSIYERLEKISSRESEDDLTKHASCYGTLATLAVSVLLWM